MKLTVHRSGCRGHFNHGWLETWHSFSFASYYNPDRMHFGALRVLNDDIIDAGMGFGTHPHDNMEIVTIVLEGELQHRDSMGNGSVIRAGEVQVMSAGTGIKHSEFNNSEKDQVKLLQIWVFPESQNLEPRYGQAKYSEEEMDGKWCRLVSPHGAGKSLWIHQQAWFSMGEFEASSSVNYELNSAGSGVYLFLISGELEVGDEKLNKRDAVCIEEIQRQVKLKISQPSKILVVEVPV